MNERREEDSLGRDEEQHGEPYHALKQRIPVTVERIAGPIDRNIPSLDVGMVDRSISSHTIAAQEHMKD